MRPEQLIQLIKADKIDKIRKLIEAKMISFGKDYYLASLDSWLNPIQLAAYFDRPQILNALLDTNLVGVNNQTREQYSKVALAFYYISFGFWRRAGEYTALHLATLGHPKIACILTLLKHGASYLIKDSKGNYPLTVHQLFSLTSQAKGSDSLDLSKLGHFKSEYLEPLEKLALYTRIKHIKLNFPLCSLTDIFSRRNSFFGSGQSRAIFDLMTQTLKVLANFRSLETLVINAKFVISTRSCNNIALKSKDEDYYIAGYQANIAQLLNFLLQRCPNLKIYNIGSFEHHHTTSNTRYRYESRQRLIHGRFCTETVQVPYVESYNVVTPLYTLDNHHLEKIRSGALNIHDINKQMTLTADFTTFFDDKPEVREFIKSEFFHF